MFWYCNDGNGADDFISPAVEWAPLGVSRRQNARGFFEIMKKKRVHGTAGCPFLVQFWEPLNTRYNIFQPSTSRARFFLPQANKKRGQDYDPANHTRHSRCNFGVIVQENRHYMDCISPASARTRTIWMRLWHNIIQNTISVFLQTLGDHNFESISGRFMSPISRIFPLQRIEMCS